MKTAVLLPNMVQFPSESMKRYARELADALRKVADPEWAIEEIVCEHVEAAQRAFPGEAGVKMASRLGRFVRYPRLAARAHGDVFHVLDHSHANLTLSLNGARSVLTCHDIIPLLAARKLVPMPSGRFTKYTFPLRIRCMKRCRYLIAISESTKRDLINHAGIPADRIEVVYYGVNRSFLPEPAVPTERAALLAKYNLPQDAKVILHVGTATRYKNTPALFHALHTLRKDAALKDSVYLLRVGADFYDDETALAQELGVTERIVHAGKIFDDALLASHYRSADVFAFPSLWEGFGWPPLEAMACGTPVVTSDVASLPEVVGDAGRTVAPRDHDALARELREILTRPELRAELRARCIARSQRFTWEECARGTLAVYERIATESAGVAGRRTPTASAA